MSYNEDQDTPRAEHVYTPADRERDDRQAEHAGIDMSKVPVPMPTGTLDDARRWRDLLGRDETVFTPERRQVFMASLNARIAHAEEFTA